MYDLAPIVYTLCLVTSTICAGLLIRNYRRHRASLLLWSAACFAFLALNNLIVVMDVFVFPGVDLTELRIIASLAGVSTLIFGFIWEIER